MYNLALDHYSPLSIATYDPDSGELYLEFDYDRLLDTQGEWSNGRHIDAVTFMGEAYPIIIHDDDGPRDANGSYIFDLDTVDNIFTINVGTGHDPSDGALEFGLSDREDGTGPLFSFALEDGDPTDPDTSAAQTFVLTATADDGVATIDAFGEEDSISIGDETFNFDYLYTFATNQRQITMDVDTGFVTDSEGNEQILLYTNSNDEGEIASYDELIAVLNVTDGFTQTGTSEADTFELTVGANDGVVTVNDFGEGDTVSIGADTFDFDYLYAFATAQRQISMDVDTNFVTDDEGNEQILLFANSNGEGEVTSYDELFAVLNVADENTPDPDIAPTLVYALNAGGDAFTAANGIEYEADTIENGRAFSTNADIAGTNDDSLYQTEKWAKTLSYETEVENGTYDVELNLAEIWGGAQTAGKRVIDIFIEDELVFNDLDLADDAGFQTALDLVGQVTVEDGSLSIRATGDVQNAKLAGFAIWESEGALSETFEVGSLYDDLSL
jgi:hypothetical protein